MLLRDVTDLRRRDRELVTKDATIREIHHRVKNNLQTVAALLRLQARRIDAPDAKAGPRGGGPPGRVDRDRARDPQPVAARSTSTSTRSPTGSGRMVTEVSALGERVRVRRTGSFGVLPSEAATALAMVLTEVLQNAVEHGYDADATTRGVIVVSARRLVGRLHVTVEDDGRGLPEDFDPETSTHLGPVDRAHAGGVRARRAARDRRGARAGRRHGCRMDVPAE